MSKMANVQFWKMTTDFELFSSLSKGIIYFFLLFTSNLSYFNSVKLPYKIRLLAFRSPLKATSLFLFYMREIGYYILFGACQNEESHCVDN